MRVVGPRLGVLRLSRSTMQRIASALRESCFQGSFLLLPVGGRLCEQFTSHPSQRREGWGTRSFCGWLRVAGLPLIITPRGGPQHLFGEGRFFKPASNHAAGTSYPRL